MALGQRIKNILLERDVKQVAFAKTLGVSPNYVNQIVNDKKLNISDTLAKLIEETYGYSAHWIMTGEGEKLVAANQSEVKLALLKKVPKMEDDEIIALLAFSDSLDSVKKRFALDMRSTEKEQI